MTGIGICGMGIIGRCALRAALGNKLFAPVAVSDIKDPATLATLLAVDSNYGRWPERVKYEDGHLVIGARRIRFVDANEGAPEWGKLGVGVVIDCTSFAVRRPGAEAHFGRGAKKVLVSAASKTAGDCDIFLLRGINEEAYDPAAHHIVSMASCTTNALAPLVKVLLAHWGIASGFFSTVHAYTNTQSLIDQPLANRRDSWAAAANIIPAESGAAKALRFVWPDLPITGKAYRVPVPTGSIVELVARMEKECTAEQVRDAFRAAASSPPLEGVMGVFEEEFASSRIVGESLSSIVDLPLVQVMNGRLLSVAAWYDNQMGYATRLVETALELASSV